MPTTLTKPTALSAVLLLALTACGDDDNSEADGGGEDQAAENGDSGGAEEVFDFTSGFYEPVTGPYDEVLIEIPSDLLQADDTYRENRVLDAAIIRSADHSDSQCAVEIEYLYADGAESDIESNEWQYELGQMVDDGWGGGFDFVDLPLSQRFAYATGLEVLNDPATNIDGIRNDGSIEEYENLADDFQSAVVPTDCAPSPTEGEGVEVTFNAIEEWRPERDEYETRGGDIVQGGVCDGDVQIEDTPEPSDDDPVEAFCHTAQPRMASFAQVTLTVMASGDIHITNSHVEEYHYDEENGWLHEDQTVDSQGNVIDG